MTEGLVGYALAKEVARIEPRNSKEVQRFRLWMESRTVHGKLLSEAEEPKQPEAEQEDPESEELKSYTHGDPNWKTDDDHPEVRDVYNKVRERVADLLIPPDASTREGRAIRSDAVRQKKHGHLRKVAKMLAGQLANKYGSEGNLESLVSHAWSDSIPRYFSTHISTDAALKEKMRAHNEFVAERKAELTTAPDQVEAQKASKKLHDNYHDYLAQKVINTARLSMGSALNAQRSKIGQAHAPVEPSVKGASTDNGIDLIPDVDQDSDDELHNLSPSDFHGHPVYSSALATNSYRDIMLGLTSKKKPSAEDEPKALLGTWSDHVDTRRPNRQISPREVELKAAAHVYPVRDIPLKQNRRIPRHLAQAATSLTKTGYGSHKPDLAVSTQSSSISDVLRKELGLIGSAATKGGAGSANYGLIPLETFHPLRDVTADISAGRSVPPGFKNVHVPSRSLFRPAQAGVQHPAIVHGQRAAVGHYSKLYHNPANALLRHPVLKDAHLGVSDDKWEEHLVDYKPKKRDIQNRVASTGEKWASAYANLHKEYRDAQTAIRNEKMGLLSPADHAVRNDAMKAQGEAANQAMAHGHRQAQAYLNALEPQK